MSKKESDAFLTASEQLLKKLEDNKGILGLILAIAVIGSGAWLGMNYWQNRLEAKAVADIYQYEAQIESKKEELAKGDEKTKESKKNENQAETEVNFDQQYTPLTQKLEDSIVKYQDTAAAKMSAVQLIGFYLEHKKFDLAQGFLTKLQLNDQGLMSGLLLVQKATLLLSQKEFDSSAQLFQEIVNNKSLEFLHPQALLRMGICYEKLQNFERAREIYTRVSTDYPDSEASRSAKFYLRLLTLNATTKASAG